ncbi:hypothetical protein POPTR_010G084201v4 [Populus trichocarpa]|uniref:Uncharacterized protein n=1 Tax=Populus trichocarpa TaxID=3694 RepID=A0ACC0SC07_POPTR|nr:hypothetical protein POPTR_010G084201v4 [Populus trichocarpa]
MDKRRKKEEAVNDPCQLPPFHRSWKENIKFVLYIPHFASVAKQTWHQELLKEDCFGDLYQKATDSVQTVTHTFTFRYFDQKVFASC